MPTSMYTYPKNLVKIGPVHFKITGLEWDHKKDKNKVTMQNIQPFGMTESRSFVRSFLIAGRGLAYSKPQR